MLLITTGLAFLMAARALAAGRATSPGAELAIGRRIVNQEALGGESPDRPFTAGETVYAATAISGLRAGFVEHVWRHRGIEVARHYIPVPEGASRARARGFRTWSRRRLARGEYTVEVLGPDGQRLAWHSFTAF